MKGRESLLTGHYLAKGDPTWYQYEQGQMKADLEQGHLNEPRMLSVKQVRDLFFSLWNNSQAVTRIRENEGCIENLQAKCTKLQLEDEQLSSRINLNNQTTIKSFEDLQKDIKQSKTDNERKFGDFFHRIQNNFDSIKKLKTLAEE